MGYAAGAVSTCVRQDPTGGGPPDWVLRGETPTGAQSIFDHRGSGQRKIHAAIEKLPRGPRGVVEGGLDLGDWYDVCGLVDGCVYTRCSCCPCRCSFVS